MNRIRRHARGGIVERAKERDDRAQTDQLGRTRPTRSGGDTRLARRVIGDPRRVITERGTKHRHHVCRGA
jgi:hypothetical protein